MAVTDRGTLKGYFNTGDTPTQGNFADLIDSLLSLKGSATNLSALGTLLNATQVVLIDSVTGNMYYTTLSALATFIGGVSNTDALPEGTTNLYFTQGRVRAAISAGTGLSYNSTTGVFILNVNTDGVSEGSTNKYFTNARAQAAISTSGNELSYSSGTGVIGKNKAIQTITYASSFTFNVANGYNAQITLTGNATLGFSNAIAGEYYCLKVIQDSTGGRTLALPASCKVVNAGAGAVTLTIAANAIDILCFFYDGTNYFVTIGTNFS